MKDSEPIKSADLAEFWQLTQACCNGTQMPQDRDRLEAMLWNSAELQARYIEYLTLHADLKSALRSFDDPAESIAGRPSNCLPTVIGPVLPVAGHLDIDSASPPGLPLTQCRAAKHRGGVWLLWSNRWLRWTPAVAAAVFLFAIWLQQSGFKQAETPDSPKTGYARLTRTTGCAWPIDRIAPQVGQRIGHEGIELAQGVVEIEFDSGAKVVLESPAHLTVTGPNRAVLRHGKLAAEVPPQAVGFTVDTPSTTLVDLGTEFGIAVGQDGASEAHVFKGEVQLKSSVMDDDVDEVTQLREGESVRVDVEGVRSRVTDSQPSSFQRSVSSEEKTRTVAVTTADGLGADSYIRRGTQITKIGDANFGGDVRLGAKATYKPIDQRKIWLRFELPDKTTPLSKLRRAAIKLTTLSDPWGESVDRQKVWEFEVWAMKDTKHAVSGDGFPSKGGWREGKAVSARSASGLSDRGKRDSKSLTWNNAGGNVPRGEGVQPEYFTLAGKFSIVGSSTDGHEVEISTPELRDFIADDSNGLVSFVIVRKTSQPSKSESSIHWFASKENKSFPAPQLILSYDPK